MKLDTTKVYYLGDLSNEQLEIFSEQLIKDGFTWNEPILIGHLVDEYCCVKYKSELNRWCWSNEKSKSTNALTLFDKTDYRDIILDEETCYNLDGISKEQYNELQNEYNGNRRFCIVDLQHKENEKLDENLCLGKFGEDWMVFYTTKENKKEFKNIIDLFNNRRIISIQLRIQELNNELIELDEEMIKLSYDKKEN